MRRIIVLAFCLLTTPVVAASYTIAECDTIEQYLNLCAEGPESDGTCWGTRSTNLAHRLYSVEQRHSISREKLNDICYSVCWQDVTSSDVLRKYCQK